MVRQLRSFDNLRQKLEHQQAQWPASNNVEMDDTDSSFHANAQLNSDKRRRFSTIGAQQNHSGSLNGIPINSTLPMKIPTVTAKTNISKDIGTASAAHRRAISEQRLSLRPPASVKQSSEDSSREYAFDQDIYQNGPSVDSANMVNESGAILLQDTVKNFMNKGTQTDSVQGRNDIFSGTSAINITVGSLFSNEAMNKFLDVFEKVATSIVSNQLAASKTIEKGHENDSSSESEDFTDDERIVQKGQDREPMNGYQLFCEGNATEAAAANNRLVPGNNDWQRSKEKKERYYCPLCSFSSTNGKFMNAHVKTHSNKNSVKCTLCSYATPINRNLKRHMRIHTGEKPYKCSECTYASAYKFYLRTHYKNVHQG